MASETPGEGSSVERRFAQTFVLFCAAQAWVLARTSGKVWLAYAVFVTACFAGTFDRRFFRAALASTFGGIVAVAAWRFPLTANHLYLQGFIALLLAVTSFDDERETRVCVTALRTILIGVFF